MDTAIKQIQPFDYRLFDQISINGICVISEDYTAVFWNRVLEDWTGMARDEILDQDITAFFPAFGEPDLRQQLSHVFGGGGPTTISSRAYAHLFPSTLTNGQMRIQRTTITPLTVEDPQPRRSALVVVEDVTESTRRVYDFKIMRDKALEEIRRRELVKEALTAERDYTARIIKASPSIVCGMTADGRTTFINPSGEQILGYRAVDLAGRHWWETFFPGSEFRQVESMVKMFDGMDVVNYDLQFTTRNGQKRTISWSSTKNLNDRGEIIEIIGFGSDITERQKALNALQKAKNNAEQTNVRLQQAIEQARRATEEAKIANAAKSEFLANISHELRTPLNSILLISHLLSENEDHTLSDKQLEFLHTIYRSGEDLLNLINNILDLSKIEAQKREIHVEQFVIREFLSAIRQVFQPVTDDKGLKFEVVLAPDTPREIHTDVQAINQIVKNLLANAIKFTERGSVKLSIKRPAEATSMATRILAADQAIAFEVSDTGIGISEDKKTSIFEAFSQEDGTISKKYGGTGLGLSISKGLADAIGGQLTMASVKGEGSTFTLIVPETAASTDETLESTAIAPNDGPGSSRPRSDSLNSGSGPTVRQYDNRRRSSGTNFIDELRTQPPDERPSLMFEHPKKVLVVDDNMRDAFILTSILESKGFTVSIAKSGAQGIEKLKQENDIELVLMDISKAELNGIEAIAHIRKMIEFNELPIIALAENTAKTDHQMGPSAGVSDVLQKPIEVDRLFESLRNWLSV